MHARRQHAVGQGGFHVGELVAPGECCMIHNTPDKIEILANRKFRYVYDCGSRQSKRCKFVVDRHLKQLAGQRLDLLFLSHFDDDHVNGVPDLLGAPGGMKVETIVMPWVDDVERLISFGRSYGKPGSISGFFCTLIADPAEALSGFNPERIVFLRGRPEPPDPDAWGPVFVGPREGPDHPIVYKMRADDVSSAAGRPGSPEGQVKNVGKTDVVEVDEGAVIEAGTVGTGFSWLFKPYVRRADPALVSAFENEAARLLGWPWGSFRKNVASASVRTDLVHDPVKSRALAAAYKFAFKDRNLTSMCLYSGPAGEMGDQELRVKLEVTGPATVHKIGWMGTGDAALKEARDERAFLRRYGPQRDFVATFSLPHHGSKRNYSPLVVAAFAPDICLASAKPPRNWKHPHPDVIADVTGRGARAVVVDDHDISSFEETFAMMG